MFSRFLWRGRAAAGLVGLGALLGAACGSSGPAVTKTSVTFAEQPGASPNYIFPLTSLKYFSVYNIQQFQILLYRPLYWFSSGGQVKLNDSLSLANEPVYSADGRTVTITLKPYKWSDGTSVTSRDVEFWLNLQKANKASWAGYSPGEWPDNLASFSVDSPTQLTLHLTQQFGSYFFTYNELSQITPLPQHVWDKQSATGSVGDYDRTADGAKSVFQYLDSESGKLSTYATNPLWQVVDGPWKLSKFDTNGNLTMVPNTSYSGPVKPTLAQFNEVAYTKDSAELNQLETGGSATNAIDYGYIPLSSAVPGVVDRIKGLGYTPDPWYSWSITYFPINFTNPTSGPIFSQLYFRQAIQHLVDQKTIIAKAYNTYAIPGYGPVPLKPGSAFADQFEQSNPYPFSPDIATSLLKDHGWTVNPGGISTCTSPGSGANQCGPGVPSGAQASFHLEFSSGNPATEAEMDQFKTDLSRVGIRVNLSQAPFNTVLGNAVPCTPGQPCKWDMENWGGGWTYSPDYYPTGDEIFSTGAGSNAGGYSSALNDQLTLATETSNSVDALHKYEDNLARDLPAVWLPTQDNALSVINSHLKGVIPQDPTLALTPETWSWS
jgi:peptide/nickel transport system substrate-binding protein